MCSDDRRGGGVHHFQQVIQQFSHFGMWPGPVVFLAFIQGDSISRACSRTVASTSPQDASLAVPPIGSAEFDAYMADLGDGGPRS